MVPVQAAYPHLQQVYRDVGPALVCVFLMMTAATWLLLHSASQWSRTRCEAKLLSRLPNAAVLAAAQQGTSVDVPVMANGSSWGNGHHTSKELQLSNV